MEVFILMLVVVGVVVTIASVKSGGSSGNPIWSAAAQRLGLQYELSDTLRGPSITGTRRGLSVNIDTFSKSGDDNRTYTRYRVHFKEPLGLGLRIAQQGPLVHISRKLGSKDIETGDSEFDEMMLVKGRDPELVNQFLTYPRKLRVLRFFMTNPGASIDDTGIQFEERNVARSPDRIVQIVQRMTALAEQLTGEESGADYLEAMTVPDQVEIRDHEIIMHERTEPWPVTLEELLQEESDDAGVEEHEDSSLEEPDTFDAPTPPEPKDIDRDLPRIEESRAEKVASSVDDGTDIGTVVQTLFAPGVATSQATGQFENVYKGKSVVWSGTLTNVRSYRFDLVFGDVPGTRAEFEIETEGSVSTGRPTKAVVQFQPREEEKLRSMVDKRVAFRGVLTSCDAYMKTLFLVNGQIDEVEA